MTREESERTAATELARAQQAREEGNEGKRRVCARRAAGAVLVWWAEATGRRGWPPDALALLRRLGQEEDVPGNIRAAAERLTARITPDFRPPHAEDPADDARLLIGWLLAAAGDRPPGR